MWDAKTRTMARELAPEHDAQRGPEEVTVGFLDASSVVRWRNVTAAALAATHG